MHTNRARCFALLLLALAPVPAQAGLLPGHHDDCPRPSYSCLHYWAPALYRARNYCHPPQVGMHAPDRCLGVSPNYEIIKFPCPAVPPGGTPYGSEGYLKRDEVAAPSPTSAPSPSPSSPSPPSP